MNQSQKKQLVIGIASVLSLGGVSYLLYKRSQSQKSQNQVQKKKNIEDYPVGSDGFIDLSKLDKQSLYTLYIDFLKGMLYDFQPLIDELESFAKYIKANAIQKGQDPQAEDIKLTMLANPSITQKMNDKEDSVYKRFKLDKKQMREIADAQFKNDTEVERLLKKTQSLIEKASSGENLAEITPIPMNLNASKAFEITQKCLMISNVQLQKALMNLKAKNGKINYESEETTKVVNSIDLFELREKLFRDEGITGLEDPATRVLRAAMFKFMNHSPETFQPLIQKLEERHQVCYKEILDNPDKILDFKKIYDLKYEPKE